MGPIRYLTLYRMHQVRNALLFADASNTNVTRVAMEYGFCELGRFSVAYRSFFYEWPCETLSRARPYHSTMLKMVANPTPANSQVSKNGSHVAFAPYGQQMPGDRLGIDPDQKSAGEGPCFCVARIANISSSRQL
jgi:Helix-turn-helix domain